MYDAKLEEKDERMKYDTIKDRSYFQKVPYDSILSTKACHIPTEYLFE
jgi:hypothetical protein